MSPLPRRSWLATRVGVALIVLLAAASFASSASAAAWSAYALPNPPGISGTDLAAISCVTSVDCTAVGHDSISGGTGGALGETWNGSSWTFESGVTRNPGPKNGWLHGVSCVISGFCTAAGTYGTSGGVPNGMTQELSAANWYLTTFSPAPIGSRLEFNGVSCTGVTPCMAVGYVMINGDDKPVAFQHSASGWNDTLAVRQGNAAFKGVSCTSSSYCLAVGSTGSSTLAQLWNGTSWSTLTAPPVPTGYQNAVLNGVDCVSSTWCMAVGTYKNSSGLNRPFADVWNGSSWSTTPTLNSGFNPEALGYGVSCISTSECWIVGDQRSGSTVTPWGALWTGTTWAIGALPSVPGTQGGQLRGVSCTGPNQCKAVGWSLVGSSMTGLVETLTP